MLTIHCCPNGKKFIMMLVTYLTFQLTPLPHGNLRWSLSEAQKVAQPWLQESSPKHTCRHLAPAPPPGSVSSLRWPCLEGTGAAASGNF